MWCIMFHGAIMRALWTVLKTTMPYICTGNLSPNSNTRQHVSGSRVRFLLLLCVCILVILGLIAVPAIIVKHD